STAACGRRCSAWFPRNPRAARRPTRRRHPPSRRSTFARCSAGASRASGAGSIRSIESIRARHAGLDWPELGLALEFRPVLLVELHELLGDGERLFVRGHLDDGVPSDDLLGLGERAVDDTQLAVAHLDLLPAVRGFEAGAIDEDSLLDRVADEFTHRFHEAGRRRLATIILDVLDQHHVPHGTGSWMKGAIRVRP